MVSTVVRTRDDELDSYYHACLMRVSAAEVIYPFMHVILTSQIVSLDSGGADQSTFQIDNFRATIFPQPTLRATSVNPRRVYAQLIPTSYND